MKIIKTLIGLGAISIALFTANASLEGKHQEEEAHMRSTATHQEDIEDYGTTTADTLSGIIKMYDANTGIGCFYVDPEMVQAGVAKPLGHRADKGICIDEKYGNGVPIDFSQVDPDSDYPGAPPEDILQMVMGHWRIASFAGHGQVSIFQVHTYEPFF